MKVIIDAQTQKSVSIKPKACRSLEKINCGGNNSDMVIARDKKARLVFFIFIYFFFFWKKFKFSGKTDIAPFKYPKIGNYEPKNITYIHLASTKLKEN